MSINWNWKDKIGEATDERGYTVNIYKGNCFMIGVNEFTNEEGVDQYSLAWFFADKDHFKNCIGTNKGYEENSIEDYKWVKLKLNTDYKQTKEFLTEISKLKLKKPIQIELYYEKVVF